MAEILHLPLFSDPTLQGYWRLESNFTDSSPNGYNLTAVNTPTDVLGVYGNGKDFEAGSSQRATIARASCPNIRITGSQSWVCWVKQETLTSYQFPMSLVNGDNSGNHGIVTSADSGGIVYFQFPGLTTNTQVSSGATILTTGTWYHLAGVYNTATSTLKIYINGVEAGSVTSSGSVTDITTGGFALGSMGSGTVGYFDGVIDDAAIFSKALTPTEILSLVNELPSTAYMMNFF